ncbi:MAG: endolytic transglycosylase MltG [Candidatus Krumholzibacteriota bacterium]|nr:endolytic transglycosylase MltG [Candidatus Krumholzibacteriota bacterium]
MSRRSLRPAAALVALALIAGLAGLRVAWTRAPGPARGDTIVVIPPGWSPPRIARELAGAGVLARPRLFLWGLRLTGAGEDLKAGRYRFPRPASCARIQADLREGRTERLWLTLPEGLWLDEAVGLMARDLGLDSLDLARRVRRPAAWNQPFLAGRSDLEGFLFPDTYAVEYPPRAEALLDQILDRCGGVLAELAARAPADWPFGPAEWVTLASIVEAEARLDEERPRIAAVYLNRLRRGMRLEADPTVMYALGERRPRLYYKHLAVDSPYNTYRHAGLPPGPICNPGRRSLESLLEADPADRSLYFVATGDGGHLFSETLAEHRRKVAALRRGRP